MKAHATLSPSAAHRWLHCPAAPLLEAREPDAGSVYAEEGSLAHRLCELKLREAAAEELKTARGEQLYAPEMEEHTDGYVAYVRSILAGCRERTRDARLMVEVRLDLSDYAPECFGTADAVVVGDDELHVVDFKYGRGVAVDARENPQLRIYALGALEALADEFAPRRVTMHIYQPRLCAVSQDRMAAAELREWGRTVLSPGAEAALRPGAAQQAGDWCRFCKVRRKCRALAEWCGGVEAAGDPRLLRADELPQWLERVTAVKTWASELEAYGLQLVLDGTEVPGWKAVEGRSVRTVKDEPGLADALEAAGYDRAALYRPRQLLPLTELERAVGKKKFAELAGAFIEKPAGKPTLAPASDRRPALAPHNAADDFKDYV